jgi:sensor histidine kinase YesM
MLEDFIVYLRASLDATRGSTTDLGRELDLLRRYLSIFQYRMGRRLTYSIECPEALRALPIAPMLLQPLVENAIEHGLEPKIEGGSVSVCVSATPLMVTIAVADTGLGFFGIAGGGVGLANVRERLQLLYGNEAKLVVQEHKPVGTLASISIPAFNLAHSDAASGTRLPPTDGVRARAEVVLKDSEQGGETDFRLSGTGS